MTSRKVDPRVKQNLIEHTEEVEENKKPSKAPSKPPKVNSGAITPQVVKDLEKAFGVPQTGEWSGWSKSLADPERHTGVSLDDTPSELTKKLRHYLHGQMGVRTDLAKLPLNASPAHQSGVMDLDTAKYLQARLGTKTDGNIGIRAGYALIEKLEKEGRL